jgi:S-adenosylmethionine decarboxylase
VPLIDSGISLYVWTGPRFLSMVAFTCKAFEAAAAVEATRGFFAMSEIEHTSF